MRRLLPDRVNVEAQRATADPGRAGAAGCREGERRILMAGEAAVSDPIGLALAWAASLASIAVAVVAAGHAGVYKRDEQSATPWGLLISGGTALPLAGHPFA